MKPATLRVIACAISALSLSSCDVIFDSAFESKRVRNIREDSENLKEDRPLEHFRTERRLNLDRENRQFEELQSM